MYPNEENQRKGEHSRYTPSSIQFYFHPIALA